MTKQQIRLTDKEEEVMLLLWEYGPCSVKTLVEHMADPKPHQNTVATFVRILEQKGLVDHRSNSRGYDYFATLSKNGYRKSTVGRMIRNFFGNSFSMVSHLVAEDEITADQLRELLDMVEKGKKNEGTGS